MKVLFVGLDYHTYTRALISEMEAQGAEVRFVDIQPRNLFFRFFRTLARGRYEAFLREHHERSIRAATIVQPDRVVFLQAHQVEPGLLATMRQQLPGVPFVLYNWDSLSTHDYLAQSVYFDQIFTFDRSDAVAHGFHYLPLFALRELQTLRRDLSNPGTVYMVGNLVNPDRYVAIRAFKTYCDDNGIIFDAFIKVTPVVYLRMLRRGTVPRGVSFRSIDPMRFHRLIERSAAVFDFANHHQSGFTMRVFENLCAGKKIITNNPQVCQESFFSADRFHVFENLDFTGVKAFIDTPLADPDASFADYHIQAFVKHIIDGTGHSLRGVPILRKAP